MSMFKVLADLQAVPETKSKTPAQKKQKTVKVATPELARLPEFPSMNDGGTVKTFTKKINF